MKGPETLINNMSNNKLKSSDIFIFLKQLEEDIKQGKANASKNDIQWFQVFGFMIKKLETAIAGDPSNMRSSDWRKWVDDYSKLHSFVEEMEENNLVSGVSWYIPDIAVFDINNRTRYKEYVYSKIRMLLTDIYGSEILN
ncbi:hypothetical protein D5R95_08045 [Methanosalsum natronophilum]|uniref:Uncharacterized protein n=1 Tax=Methanosalsum natronophilum TaxID=768733 RepID=A0A3R7X4A9_9EURY|nr:MAG: hypothetical protein D5R95_08045 [Methanosalsum natronophilum]